MLPFLNQLLAGIGMTVCVLSLCAGVKALALCRAGKKTRKRRRSWSK